MQVQHYLGKKPLEWGKVGFMDFVNQYTPEGWEEVFEAAREDIFPEIAELLDHYAGKQSIFPQMPYIFNIFEHIKPSDVKVFLSGQDPYIHAGEAMGMSFSVPEGVKIPPSLKNMFKELEDEGYSGYSKLKSGDLTFWVERGVFLYNSCLTVKAGESGSHGDLWLDFTDLVISYLKQQDHIAWILLGEKAKRISKSIDKQKHGVFETSHPSPFSVNRGFLGSGIFEEVEEYLNKHHRKFTWKI